MYYFSQEVKYDLAYFFHSQFNFNLMGRVLPDTLTVTQLAKKWLPFF